MAVTITATAFAEAIGADSATATRLLAVASELVNRHAPVAPVAIQNEAAIRTAGWLAEQPSAAITRSTASPSTTRLVSFTVLIRGMPQLPALRLLGQSAAATAVHTSTATRPQYRLI